MVGTTISMQNTKQMLYPSITFCESTTSARIYAGGSWYASWYAFYNKTIPSHEFEDLFIGLYTKMPNTSMFTLRPSDINDRVAHVVFSKFLVFLIM